MTIHLDLYKTMALVSVVFYIGKFLRREFTLIKKYCIPPSVIGGFMFAIIILIFHMTGFATVHLDLTLQNIFMTAFFTSIGFTASIKILKEGGIKVVLFLGLAVLLVILQNTVGVSLASMFGLSPLLGLCTASIPMVGGHGTAGSFGPMLENMGIASATTVSVASATFGLIMGSIIGGLVARGLIHKHKLHTVHDENSEEIPEEVGDYNEENHNILSFKKLISGASFLFIAMGLGSIVSEGIEKLGFTFPSYIGAMVVASIIRNIMIIAKKQL